MLRARLATAAVAIPTLLALILVPPRWPLAVFVAAVGVIGVMEYATMAFSAQRGERFLTIALGGLSLVGLPPSGGFSAKWLMLQASVASGQWFWTLPILAGGLLAAGYVYRVLAPALSGDQIALVLPPKRSQEAIALALAMIAIALGFAPQTFFDFLEIGRPVAAGLP